MHQHRDHPNGSTHCLRSLLPQLALATWEQEETYEICGGESLTSTVSMGDLDVLLGDLDLLLRDLDLLLGDLTL
jgi:hypothetical protein